MAPSLPPLALRRGLPALGVAVLLALVARDFAFASTFLGDDHVFRAYARLEGNPLWAFVADKHGGEYYRPLPMLLWWLSERVFAGHAWGFAAVAFLLHLSCSLLLALVGHRLGLARPTALLAGVLFFVAPAEREAALWFSASTDLLSVAAMLGSLAAFLGGTRGRRALSVLLAALAFWSKETALVLPVLLVAAAWFQRRGSGVCGSVRSCLLAALPHSAVAAVYLAARFLVLGGWGGTGDPAAPWWGWALQLGGGLVHAVTANEPLPEWVAWLLGAAILAAAATLAWRRHAVAGFALLLAVVPLLPLPAAGWMVGARYFYLSAAGVMLLAAMALESAGPAAAVTAVTFLVGLGVLSGSQRARDVALHGRAVAAASAAVEDGLRRGYRLFLVRGAVKDLDLAVKLARNPARPTVAYVVLADIPASFLWLPDEQAARLGFLLARPPLPPAGAYRFAEARIVGQARRDEAPGMDEVLERLPELRIIQLVRRGEDYGWEDRTAAYRRAVP